MTNVLTIGDSSRDGMFQITDTAWDSNGTMNVTVRHLLDMSYHPEFIRSMRRLARKAIHMPHLTRSSQVVKINGSSVTFAVSRLEP